MKVNFSTVSERLCDSFGSHPAIFNVERGRSYSYAQFHALTNRIVNMMRSALGLRRGDIWFNILNNDNLSLLHYFTALKGESSACYTNYRDSAEQHRWQIGLLSPKVVFIEAELVSEYYEFLSSRGIQIVSMDPVAGWTGVKHFWELVDAADTANPDIIVDDRDAPLILRFTGGTTGKGKCAAYSMDSWLACRDSFYMLPEADWRDSERVLHLAPMSHGSGMLALPALFKGGCNVTLNGGGLETWCRSVEEQRITYCLMIPTLLYRLLDMRASETGDLSSLRNVFYGAAPISPAKLQGLRHRFGDIFTQIYASTEHPAVATCMTKRDHAETDRDASHLASAGRTVPGTEVVIADDAGRPVARGEIGEIWLRSRGTCSGYYLNPEQTAEEFLDGFWKSGDVGRFDARGFLHIVDRKKDMIISGGFNVYAIEVEAAINAYPGVLMSAVVGLPHEEWGEAVHADVMLSPDAGQFDLGAFRQHLREVLGGYKAPKSVHLVSELPLSSAGKVLRRAVRDKYLRR
jgi:acyl-CoA synthetase (AMP-forming)/AMP-acid ligase II